MYSRNSDYQRDALRTAKYLPFKEDLVHAALGLTGEAGEFADAVKKHVVYGKQLDLENLTEELGDILWYVALACNAMGTNFNEVMTQNIKKLAVRYPTEYSDLDALSRKDKI